MTNVAKIYTDKSNCRRAARKALGTQPFDVLPADGGGFYFVAIEPADVPPEEAACPAIEPTPVPPATAQADPDDVADVFAITRAALRNGADTIDVSLQLASLAYGDEDEARATAARMAGGEVSDDALAALVDSTRQNSRRTGWTANIIAHCSVPVQTGRAATPEFARMVADARRKGRPLPGDRRQASAPQRPATADATPTHTKRERPADVLAAAHQGNIPNAPDFSFAAHKPYLKEHAALVAMVEAGDVAGLRAYKAKTYNSIVRVLARYRDNALIAIEARGRAVAA